MTKKIKTNEFKCKKSRKPSCEAKTYSFTIDLHPYFLYNYFILGDFRGLPMSIRRIKTKGNCGFYLQFI